MQRLTKGYIQGLVLILLLLVLDTHAINFNTSGFNDTAIIADFKADSLKYTKSFPLSAFENSRVVFMVNDTSAAGFGDDSIKIQWGYQTFSLCWDSNTVEILNNSRTSLDTCFDIRIELDSALTDSIGAQTIGVVDSTGVITRNPMQMDSVNVTGLAVTSKWFVPEWDTHIRFWAQGIAGNEVGTFQVIRFDYKRRQRSRSGF